MYVKKTHHWKTALTANTKIRTGFSEIPCRRAVLVIQILRLHGTHLRLCRCTIIYPALKCFCIQYDCTDNTTYLNQFFISLQVFQHKAKIAEISSHASNEYALEQMLRKVCILRKYLVFP